MEIERQRYGERERASSSSGGGGGGGGSSSGSSSSRKEGTLRGSEHSLTECLCPRDVGVMLAFTVPLELL